MIEYMMVYINNYYKFDEATLKRRFIKELKKRGLPFTIEAVMDRVGDNLLGCTFKVYWADKSPISERQKQIIIDSMEYFWTLQDAYYEVYEFGQTKPTERVDFGYLQGCALIFRHDKLPIGQKHDIESIVSECKRKMTGSLIGFMRTDRQTETVLYFYGTPREVIVNAVEQVLVTYPLKRHCFDAYTAQRVRGHNLRW